MHRQLRARPGRKVPWTPLADLRSDGPNSDDPELVGQWLLSEMLSPGGDAKRALEARKHLDEIGGGQTLANLARALDDEVHGRMKTAPDNYLRALRAARASSDERAPFIAWFAANRAVSLRGHADGLWKRWHTFVEESMKAPLSIGWRARGELVEWWADEAYAEGKPNVENAIAKEYGCVGDARFAGPFGHGAAADSFRSFPAERPGPWPTRWTPDSGEVSPRVYPSKREGCFLQAEDVAGDGIFYAETFLDLKGAEELVVAVQGALSVWIDDERVLDRDPRKWGVWPKFGVQVWLRAGRHRVVARLTDPQTSIRVLTSDGRAAGIATSADSSAPYAMIPPEVTGEPNVVSRFVKNGDVVDPHDDILRFLGGYLAWLEGQGDIASVFIEPLVKDTQKATGLVLERSALFAERDPIFDNQSVKDLTRELQERAIKRDPDLWQSQLALALWQVERAGPSEAAVRLEKLSNRFPNVPAILLSLARAYGELGWSAEYQATAKELARRFPEDVEALTAAVSVYDGEGSFQRADELVERIRRLDPDSEVTLTRALTREHYDVALTELRRLGKRRPERKDIAERIYDVMVRSGNQAESWKKLEAAVKQEPTDSGARLALADARFAGGKHEALRQALVDALVSGANPSPLEEALDLVEGTTELDPYRLDAKAIIRDYEKHDTPMPGTAARVLDYAAIWVHADGSSRMLEHEVIRIQSPEAISQLAEHPRLDGVVLHMRVIKKDGRVLEPEDVQGKPTVTFPHLEVGDYIETEHVVTKQSDSREGTRYVSPQWFFREENIAYARSEFVVITPDHQALEIETHGNVPAPKLEKKDGIVIRRWRVDRSPAAPVEPGSPPITEFLPSVRLGWGVDLAWRLQDFADTLADVTPIDPRVRRIAYKIVAPAPKKASRLRAQRLYRWVLANVEDGPETDGRRVVVGKRGNRWRGFLTLCRSIGIHAEYAVARNRLAPQPGGKIAESTQFTDPLIVLTTERGPVWLTLGSKYAPFGYVPPEIRGAPAYLLGGRKPRPATTPRGGGEDSVIYEGSITMGADGSAKLAIEQRFTGKYAMAVRSAFSQLPEAQLRDVIESKLLGRALRGARLTKHRIEHLDDLDEPFVLHMQAEMSGFAQSSPGELAISPPFSPRVSQLATLPARQTPLLIGEATYQEVRLRITLPKNATLANSLAPSSVHDADRSVKVNDRLEGNVLILDRTLDIPAGRVQPAAYPAFLEFARKSDAILARDVRVRVR